MKVVVAVTGELMSVFPSSSLQAHPSVEALMETDCEGTSGVFSAEVEEPEHSNAAASTFWEFHIFAVSPWKYV